jgi:prepilin-type N-terminal cleavage/methylation domain-containing protein
MDESRSDEERSGAMTRGMTLVEVIFALTILAIVTLGISSAFIGTSAMRQATENQVHAYNAARGMMEEIRAAQKTGTQGLDNIIATYSATGNQTFTVDRIGGTGTIILYLQEDTVPVEVGADPVTLVNSAGERFGEYDLNGDNDESDTFTTATSDQVRVLPVEVRVDWNETNGPRSVRRFLMVARLD